MVTMSARRFRWIKWVVLVAWLALLAGIGPLAGKLSGVEKNDATAFLPGKAESTQVFNELKSFPGGDSVPLVFVYARGSGLTPADLAAIDKARTAIVADQQVVGQTPPVIRSQNGQAARAYVTQSNHGTWLFQGSHGGDGTEG